jgi:hypothetical protein
MKSLREAVDLEISPGSEVPGTLKVPGTLPLMLARIEIRHQMFFGASSY